MPATWSDSFWCIGPLTNSSRKWFQILGPNTTVPLHRPKRSAWPMPFGRAGLSHFSPTLTPNHHRLANLGRTLLLWFCPVVLRLETLFIGTVPTTNRGVQSIVGVEPIWAPNSGSTVHLSSEMAEEILKSQTYSSRTCSSHFCKVLFPHHRLQRKLLVSDPGMHHSTCVTHVLWCMSGSLTRGGGENVPGIPGVCATRNITYLVRGTWQGTRIAVQAMAVERYAQLYISGCESQ